MSMSDMSGMDMDMTSSSSLVSSITSTIANMVSSTSSSMDMDMSSSVSSMATATSSSMNMDDMDMDMSTSSSASSTSTSSSMDMDMDTSSGSMAMNSYLVTTYNDYPVIFKALTASTGGAAFGIFCVIFFSAFFLRGLYFLSAYLEQRVFHNYTNAVVIQEVDNCACDPESEEEKGGVFANSSADRRPFLQKLFFPGLAETGKDFIRLLIAFVAAMFGYAIMLAAMSFVVLYFFAACLGIAFGEIFFNRLSIIMGINKNGALGAHIH